MRPLLTQKRYLSFAVHRGQVHLARVHGGQQQVGGLGQFCRIEVDGGDVESALVGDGIINGIHHFLRAGTPRLAHGVLDDFRTAHHGLAEVLGVGGRLEGVGAPGGVHHGLASNDFLVVIELLAGGVRRARIAFLMAAHAHGAGAAPTPDVMGGDDQIEQRGLDGVVVVAPDDAFLVCVRHSGQRQGGHGQYCTNAARPCAPKDLRRTGADRTA